MPSLPSRPGLDWLRKRARRLLRAARNAEPRALGAVRKVPRLAGRSDAELIENVRLADAQWVIANAYGFASWAKIKHEVERQMPLAVLLDRFLEALRSHRPLIARGLFARHPALASASLGAACATGNEAFVRAALAKRPELATATDGIGWNGMLYAAASPLHGVSPQVAAGILGAVRALLDAGADANSHTLWDPADPKSKIPALYHACMSDHVALVELLLERGAEPNDGESVYHAAEHDRRACLELLVKHGANLSGPHSTWNNTPLYFLSGHTESNPHIAVVLRGMRWLLEHGADPNLPSYPVRETPLHAMARIGRPAEPLELLLTHGADPNARRADGRTPYALAWRVGAEETAAVLERHGADPALVSAVDRFLGACMRADEAAANAALAQEPGLMAGLGDSDRGLLGHAAARDRVDVIQLMVRLGFDPGFEGFHGEPGTALHWAAWHGRPAAVRALIAAGAPLDHRDRQYGSSPIGWGAHGSRNCRSADEDYLQVLEALLDAGGGREASFNKWGEPPENLASRRVAALLRARGFAP